MTFAALLSSQGETVSGQGEGGPGPGLLAPGRRPGEVGTAPVDRVPSAGRDRPGLGSGLPAQAGRVGVDHPAAARPLVDQVRRRALPFLHPLPVDTLSPAARLGPRPGPWSGGWSGG